MFRRTETMTIKEFMNRKEIDKKKVSGVISGISTLPLVFSLQGKHTFAAEVASSEMTTKLMGAFDPLIDLVQALAYPVAMIVALGGAIMVMIGQRDKGYGMMMSAGLGIILVNIAPMVLEILIGAMKGVI
ncbi:hypothetical protein JMM81_12295 [Bacillus sp. V3B]|uniref:hypothetical protein n=1 Tax=Bacillus sp. V3B TaxID=2804915 RepID=UPI0021096613|nr:hypothetical protein [Bacillus sp. V3B]MCQ6275736.1 hypothetical protein [Bacillus sp. V3B]